MLGFDIPWYAALPQILIALLVLAAVGALFYFAAIGVLTVLA